MINGILNSEVASNTEEVKLKKERTLLQEYISFFRRTWYRIFFIIGNK